MTPSAQRILAILDRAHTAQSAAAIADALELRAVDVIAQLVELAGMGRVLRVPASSVKERDRWQLVAALDDTTETIVCRHYREHAIAGHRRDPLTQRFRCYICEPDVIAAAPAAYT